MRTLRFLHHAHPAPARRSRREWGAGIAVAAGVALALLALPEGVAASDGYNSYESTFTSSDPTGYTPAPDPTAPRATVEYDFDVTNNGALAATLSATLYVGRVVSYVGIEGDSAVDVTNPAVQVDEGTLLDAQQISVQPPVAHPLAEGDQTISGSLLSSGPTPYSEQVEVGACGYFAIWVGDNNASEVSTFYQPLMPNGGEDFLNAGIVRVTGGCTKPTPRPRPRTTFRVRAVPTATPTPAPAHKPKATPRPPHQYPPFVPLGSDGSEPPTSVLLPAGAPKGLSTSVLTVAALILAAALATATVIFIRERGRAMGMVDAVRRRFS